jgi:hypothetical protein
VRHKALIFLALAILATASPCAADTIGGDQQPPPTPTGEIKNDSPEAIVVTSPGGPTQEIRHHGSGRHGQWTCHYYAVATIDGGTKLSPLYDEPPITPQVGTLVALYCLDENGQSVYEHIFVFDPADPLGGLDLPARAAEEARKLLAIAPPVMRLSPPLGTPQLVGVPTWLWIDDPWVTLRASATLGGVTATVTATPTSVVWDLGDGSTVTCDGPGTAYDQARVPEAQQTDCAHIFQRNGLHPLTATVTYTTGWTATTGDAEPLDPITRSSTTTITVNEAQALIR